MSLSSNLKNYYFSKIHQGKLIYNTCWEDPRCDRMLLEMDEKSKVVMITSAGCNALDYLLDDPKEIHCVDMNFRQNALLELKKVGLEVLPFNTFFALFGKGASEDAKLIYHNLLREKLSVPTQDYWDKHIKYFDGKGRRKSFYYRGTSGFLAYSTTRLMNARKSVRKNLDYLFNAISLEEQVKVFNALETQIFNKHVKALVNNHYTMTLAGVPENQQILINQDYQCGVFGYLKDCFRNIFTTLDISENYFYQVYFNGHYTQDCCPEYLKQENFNFLHENTEKIKTYTTSVSDFLLKNPGEYSHFILLDHQDWLAVNDPAALEEEWELILQNSKPGTKILLRSASKEVDFFPDFIKDKIDFDKEKTKEAHALDRVGTYASVYLGIVK